MGLCALSADAHTGVPGVATGAVLCILWLQRPGKERIHGLQLRSGGAVVVTNAETSIPSNIDSEHSIASSIGVLLCILVGLRIVVYVQMCISIRRKYL